MWLDNCKAEIKTKEEKKKEIYRIIKKQKTNEFKRNHTSSTNFGMCLNAFFLYGVVKTMLNVHKN